MTRSETEETTRSGTPVTIRGGTAAAILAAAKQVLLEVGYARFSTRTIADEAGVPLSQIHYHFGSKQKLVLAVLEEENQRLLDRQKRMFESEIPIWMQWERACDFLEEDLASVHPARGGRIRYPGSECAVEGRQVIRALEEGARHES